MTDRRTALRNEDQETPLLLKEEFIQVSSLRKHTEFW